MFFVSNMKLFLGAAAFVAAAATVNASPCLQDLAVNASWEFAGPSTYMIRGDKTNMTSAGAAQKAVAGADNTWFLGSVNGGLWRTRSLGHATPHWENIIDGQPVTCSSISAVHVSAENPQRV